MRKPLPRDSFLRHIVFCSALAFLFFVSEESAGQVLLQSLPPTVIDFGSENGLPASPLETSSGSAYTRGAITLFYPADAGSSEDPFRSLSDIRFSPVQTENENFIGFSSNSSSRQEVIHIRYTNSTGRMVKQLRLRFSLGYMNSGDRPFRLSLASEITDDPAVRPIETLLGYEHTTENSEEWNTVSRNLTLENLFLADGESVTLTLYLKNSENRESNSSTGAVFLRQLVVIPFAGVNTGDLSQNGLVISEIMTENPADPGQAQYIEIYNRSENRVNLSGLGIRTGESVYRIRDTLSVAPYAISVIANMSEIAPGIRADFFLEHLTIPATGGSIVLGFDEATIFQANYREASSTTSRELISVIGASGGRADATQYRESEKRMGLNIFGSPGLPGGTSRLFSYSFPVGERWAPVSVPGSLVSDTETIELRGVEQLPKAQRGQGFFIRADKIENEYTFLVEEEGAGEDVQLTLPENDYGWHVIGSPFIEGFNFSQLGAVNGSLYGHSAQIWDSVKQTFRQLSRTGYHIEPWQPLFIRNRDASALRFSVSGTLPSVQKETDNSRERLIGFELSGINSQGERFFDEAATIYFRGESADNRDDLNSNDFYNSEKLWPVFSSATGNPKASVIYFLRQTAQRTLYLSQETRNYHPESAFEVRMGHVSMNTAGSFTLRWPEVVNIPESWNLTLVDHETGERVNMRLENSYQFESGAWFPPDPDYIGDEPAVHPVSGIPAGSRFSIQVNPEPERSITRAENQEQSDRVEFHANFPNPFSGTTTFEFYLPEESEVTMDVYTIIGQRVERLLDGVIFSGGLQQVTWNASHLPNQIFTVTLRTGNTLRSRTIIKQ